MRLLITFLMLRGLALAQAAGAVTVSGNVAITSSTPGVVAYSTNTQSALIYGAPSSSACTVEVSESPTYSPLVHDVNPLLFTDADSDGGGALARRFVAGKRLTATALDTKNYSLALQVNTLHYYRLTCDGAIRTGTFSTTNIPVNEHYQDIPQMDPANPGQVLMPTISNTDRTQTIIDPHTGALIRRVSLPGDTNALGGNAQRSGPFLNFSGSPRVCGTTLVGPDSGYLCFFPQGDGGPEVYYYIIPSTGEARFLGWSYAGGVFNTFDNKFYSTSSGNIVTRVYTGNYLGKAAEYNFNADTTTATFLTGLTAAILAFDPTFDNTNFSPTVQAAVGDFIHLAAWRGDHDSSGYVGAIRISTASVVAMARFDNNPQNRWCALHQIVPMGYDQPMFQIIPHDYVGTGGVGEGPYLTALTGNINSSVTTIDVAGEPACAACPADTSVPLARVGDYFKIGSEVVKITTKNSSTQWVVTRGARGTTAASHSSGNNTVGNCDQGLIHWKFLDDPFGADTTNTSWVRDNPWNAVAGHNDATTGMMISEAGDGWVTRAGDLMTQVGQPVTATVTSSRPFAGASSNCFGNACRKHPSVGAPGSGWFTDFHLWDYVGTKNGPNTMSLVSGSLYKLVDAAGGAIKPKHLPLAGAIGARYQGSGAPRGFLDVSPTTLGTGSGDNYKFCIANAAGECYATSAKGEVYVNAPGTLSLACNNNTNLCMANYNSVANGVVQAAVDGTKARIITGGLTGLRKTNDYPTAKALADGSYVLFAYGDIASFPPSQVLMAKLPPFTVDDGVDRTTFVRAAIPISTPQGLGITTAAVEFGYREFGATADHRCTSRAEACVAVSSTVTDATPFWYVDTDLTAGLYSRLSCATSCTITLPVLPSHIAYYTVKFYDSGGAFVPGGSSGVAIEGTVK